MGVFDTLYCKYPLPIPGMNDREYQTKDTPAQYCDSYEIRENGTLWHHDHDTEDRSDPKATGIARIIGMATPVNFRWIAINFTGEIRFYNTIEPGGWIEFSSYFIAGKIQSVTLIEHTPSKPKEAP